MSFWLVLGHACNLMLLLFSVSRWPFIPLEKCTIIRYAQIARTWKDGYALCSSLRAESNMFVVMTDHRRSSGTHSDHVEMVFSGGFTARETLLGLPMPTNSCLCLKRTWNGPDMQDISEANRPPYHDGDDFYSCKHFSASLRNSGYFRGNSTSTTCRPIQVPRWPSYRSVCPSVE